MLVSSCTCSVLRHLSGLLSHDLAFDWIFKLYSTMYSRSDSQLTLRSVRRALLLLPAAHKPPPSIRVPAVKRIHSKDKFRLRPCQLQARPLAPRCQDIHLPELSPRVVQTGNSVFVCQSCSSAGNGQ